MQGSMRGVSLILNLLQLVRDEAGVDAQHQQREQYHRERDADGERLYGAGTLSLVAHEEVERGKEAADDKDEKEDDDDFQRRTDGQLNSSQAYTLPLALPLPIPASPDHHARRRGGRGADDRRGPVAARPGAREGARRGNARSARARAGGASHRDRGQGGGPGMAAGDRERALRAD